MKALIALTCAAVLGLAAGCAEHTNLDDLPVSDDANAVDGTRSLRAEIDVPPASPTELAAFAPREVPVAAKSVAARGLRVVGRARWDDYLLGDTAALRRVERHGMVLFIRAGCSDCHDGRDIGGDQFRRLGAAVPFEALADSGRYEVTKDSADLFVYKVASLRDLESKPAYFHDGSVGKLSQAIRLMARHQLALNLTEDEVRDIRAFLSSLNSAILTVDPDPE